MSTSRSILKVGCQLFFFDLTINHSVHQKIVNISPSKFPKVDILKLFVVSNQQSKSKFIQITIKENKEKLQIFVSEKLGTGDCWPFCIINYMNNLPIFKNVI